MQGLVYRKFCTVAIVALFIGISIVPSISGSVRELSNETYVDTIIIRNYKIMEDFNSSPLFFTENQRQFPAEVLFQTHIPGATVYLCQNKLVSVFTQEQEENQIDARDNNQIHLNHRRLKEPRQLEMISIVTEFVGANPNTVVIGEHSLPHKNNYFIGNEPSAWYTDVSNYQCVVYDDIYSGIDLKYYGSSGVLKYDFIVHPGADPTQIAIHYKGAENMQITPAGDLEIMTRYGSVHEKCPVIYQIIDGAQQQVAGSYLLDEHDAFRFSIEGSYNKEYPLVIDPGLVYSTYLGGNENTVGGHIAVDNNGCVYITGWTDSTDFPMKNPYDDTYNGDFCDVFVTKFSPQGNTLEYSTFLGGSNLEIGFDIVVDDSECAYITGWSYSNDFPMVDPFNGALTGDCDAIVSKLSPQGNALIYSTFIGGTGTDGDYGGGIEVDKSGCAYVAGYTYSEDFPMKNPYDGIFNGMSEVFLTKFSPQGDTLEYSTYLGGSMYEECHCIAVDSSGCAYLSGLTYSEDFPMKNPYDDTYRLFENAEEAYVTKFSPQGNTLEYSTYLGGSEEDWSWDIAVDSSGCAYVTGQTGSSDFPTVNPYDNTYNGGYSDAYVTKFSPQGNTLEYSTFLGGKKADFGSFIAIDKSNYAYITGWTESNDFPTVNSFDGTYNGGYSDAYVTKFSPPGDTLEYSTFLGGSDNEIGYGIAVDDNENTYVSGYTSSYDFPVENPFDDTFNSQTDAFVSKFPKDGGSNAPNIPLSPLGSTNGEAGQQYTYTAVTTDPQDDNIYYLFDWGDGNDSGWVGPYISSEPGGASYTWSRGNYDIRVKAKDVNGDVSGWSEPLSVTMPKNKIINPFERFLENHPNMFQILRLILGL